MNTSDFYKHQAQTSPHPLAMEVSHAEGSYIYDEHKKAYLDFIAGVSACTLGHSNPKIVSAIKSQLDKYEELENDTKFLAEFSSRKKIADFAGFITFNKEGLECFSFGKHKGKLVTDVLEKEPGYFGWLLNADFPLYTKKVLTAIKLRSFNNKLG